MKTKLIQTSLLLLCLMAGCRKENEIVPPEKIHVAPPDETGIRGFYLLNEGNMNSNKASLDYMDVVHGDYYRDIYSYANPNIPLSLGDVGNDLQIYGGRLYAVINCSNKVEVMDKRTARRMGQIDIPNCRYIRFHGRYAYVTSYAGPVDLDSDKAQLGYVAKVDTATLEVVARCLVGYQPDELEVAGNKIYVANSGGYMFPNYENTVSVIDIQTFTEIKRIPVAINLHRLRADGHGNLWVSSRGNYYATPSQLHWVDTQTDTYGGMLDIAVSEFTLAGDSLYLYSTEFNYNSMEDAITYGIVDVASKRIVTRNFIADGAERDIAKPYGIAVNPYNRDIYLTDAENHVFPGMLFCFDRNGKKKWSVQTGDIPAHFAVLDK